MNLGRALGSALRDAQDEEHGTEDGHAVKDIRSGDQVPADPATWNPPQEDLAPLVRLSSPLNEEIHP